MKVQETYMFAVIEIATGLMVGGVGFIRMADSPVQGCCALLLAGFLLMRRIEKQLVQKKPNPRLEEKNR
jgi:hypothetical protein